MRAVVAFVLVSSLMAAEPFIAAVGSSRLDDAAAAGRAAAMLARDGLHGESVKAVFVHAPRSQMNDALIVGVSAVFPAALIHGGEVYAPFANDEAFADQGVGIRSGVAVLAIGGTCRVDVVSAELPRSVDRFAACGTALGTAIQPLLTRSEPGHAVLVFGQQHTGDNVPFARALVAAMRAPTVPVLGGAVSGGASGTVIVQGRRRTDVNVALVLSGDFRCTTGHGEPGGDPLAHTRAALAQATPPANWRPRLVLASDSRTVRETLLKRGQLTDDLGLFRAAAGNGVRYGWYGSGQIAPPAPGQPAQGYGHLLAVAVFSTK